MPGASRSLRPIDTDGGGLGSLASDRDEQQIQVRREESRSRPLYGGDIGNFLIMAGVLLLVYRDAALATRSVDPLAGFVVKHIIRVANCRKLFDDPSTICIQKHAIQPVSGRQ